MSRRDFKMIRENQSREFYDSSINEIPIDPTFFPLLLNPSIFHALRRSKHLFRPKIDISWLAVFDSCINDWSKFGEVINGKKF